MSPLGAAICKVGRKVIHRVDFGKNAHCTVSALQLDRYQCLLLDGVSVGAHVKYAVNAKQTIAGQLADIPLNRAFAQPPQSKASRATEGWA